MDKPFYANGLRFGCTRCSLCCRFETGYVFLSRQDLERLAARFNISTRQVVDRYCQIVDLGGVRRVSLAEQPNYDCIFWRGGECTVYEDRPLQCRMFPFWPAFLESRARWEEAADQCPGVGIGPTRSRTEIEEMLEQRGREPLIDADTLS